MSARKYGHRGYLEDEPREQRQKEPGRERRGPRGRGLGSPTATVSKCARCGAHFEASGKLEPDAACASCGDALHSCANCRFFDTAAVHECRAGVQERIAAKSKSNTCDLFEPKRVQEFADSVSDDDPRAAFDALFDF